MNHPIKRVEFVRKYLDGIFAEDVHAKRVMSLANGAVGVMTGASLAVSIIGQSLAQARGLLSKHAIKQVDRLLSNQGIVVWDMFAPVGGGSCWRAQDDCRRHGLDGFRRGRSGDLGLESCHQPRAGDALVVAERLEGRAERPAQRFRGSLPCAPGAGVARGRRRDDSGRSRLRRHQAVRLSRHIGVRLCHPFSRQYPCQRDRWGNASRRRMDRQGRTSAQAAGRRGYGGPHKVGAVVCVKAKDMKEAWCLAASNAEATAREIMNYYAKRWTIEPGFRDTKDLRFGMGLSVLRIADPQRRDRLLLLNAFAIVLLTLLGAAGESLGMDRHLKVNTAKHRTHSLFRQGCMLYELIPNMPDARLRPLVARFHQYLNQHEAFNQTFAIV